MDIYTTWMTVFFVLTIFLSFYLHYHFVSSSYKLIPNITHGLLIFSIFTCIAPFPLLVLDVDAALNTPHGQSVSVFHDVAHPWWLFLFIASQLMAWVALPIAQAYDCAGEFEVIDRLKEAVRVNIKMYIFMGVLVGALLGYIMFLKGASNFLAILHVTLAAANAFGLFLLVVFLACGLLGIPRRLWKMADPETLLEEEYRRARTLHDELDVAKTDVVLLRIEAFTQQTVQQRVGSTATAQDKAHLEKILATVSEFETEVALHQHGSERPDDRKHQNLVELNEDIMSAIKVCRRLNFQWHECVRSCIDLSNVVAGNTKSIYWTMIRKPLMRVSCAISIILTAVVFFSELVVPFQSLDQSRQISIVEVTLQNPATRFIAAIVFLTYMAICGYWAIFQFHVFDLFVVVPRISDAASLCFVVTFLTRLVLPLCYNFLWVADLTNTTPQLVTYSEVFGKMDVVDFLGIWFNRFMPVFIPVLAILIEAKVIHRFLQWVGVEGFETGEESEASRKQAIEEGRAIVAREANQEMRAVIRSPQVVVTPQVKKFSDDESSNTGQSNKNDESSKNNNNDGENNSKLADERKKRYEAWKAAHGGGASGGAAADNI